MWFKKKIIGRNETIELCTVLQRNRFTQPIVLLMNSPQRAVYNLESRGVMVKILTKRPIEVIGHGENIVVDDLTLSFIKALCITGLASDNSV